MPRRRKVTPASVLSPRRRARGRIRMVDVAGKPETTREAIAEGEVRLSPAALRAIREKAVAKGDPLQVARIAGIMAAKRTSEFIPLCHPLPLTHVDIELIPMRGGYRIVGRAGTVGRTGVEMEALVAVSAAALTIYDMMKAGRPRHHHRSHSSA